MKIYSIATLGILLTLCLACKYASLEGLTGGGEYSNAADKFSVTFPGGPGDVEKGTQKNKYLGSGNTYSKSFDNHSDNYRSYEVQVYDETSNPFEAGTTKKTILNFGLNGWADEPGTVVKDVTINGQQGIDSVRLIEIGPAKMTFREVVFWSDKDKRLYVIQISAVKKENASTKEADDFVNSFKLNT